MSTFSEIAGLHHELCRLEGIDRLGGRDSFFGRLEMLDYCCRVKHEEAGLPWKKFGRYGNIIEHDQFCAAIDWMREEFKFTDEEFTELAKWMHGQATPDQVVGAVYLRHWMKRQNDKN
jgi:hypothetical protein